MLVSWVNLYLTSILHDVTESISKYFLLFSLIFLVFVIFHGQIIISNEKKKTNNSSWDVEKSKENKNKIWVENQAYQMMEQSKYRN